MLPKYHLILGFFFSLIFFSFLPSIGFLGFMIIFLSSFLIDFDHYTPYVIRNKDFSLKNALKWHQSVMEITSKMPREEKNKVYVHMCFLHGIEVLFILFLLGHFVSHYFYFVLIGFSFHLIIDVIYEQTYWDRIDKLSLIYDYFHFKKLKKLDGF